MKYPILILLAAFAAPIVAQGVDAEGFVYEGTGSTAVTEVGKGDLKVVDVIKGDVKVNSEKKDGTVREEADDIKESGDQK